MITHRVIIEDVLRSFADWDTEAIWRRQGSARMDVATQRLTWLKLAMLDAADVVTDLRLPPGNRLRRLSGDRAGQYSIDINRQWRICFSWTPAGPVNVEITPNPRATPIPRATPANETAPDRETTPNL